MGERLATRWWSLELSEGWSAFSDEDCTTVESKPSLGALQLSEVFKDRDAVTDRDLTEYARKCLGQQVQLGPIQLGDFVGYSAHYEREGTSWTEYWLRCGVLLLYVTYNATVADAKVGLPVVDLMLASLRGNSEATDRKSAPSEGMIDGE